MKSNVNHGMTRNEEDLGSIYTALHKITLKIPEIFIQTNQPERGVSCSKNVIVTLVQYDYIYIFKANI